MKTHKWKAGDKCYLHGYLPAGQLARAVVLQPHGATATISPYAERSIFAVPVSRLTPLKETRRGLTMF